MSTVTRRSVAVPPSPVSEQGITPESSPKMCETSAKFDIHNTTNITAGKLYHNCNNAPKANWFSLGDCAWRYFMTVALHYWALVTSPFAYTYYTFKHNMLWYGTVPGFALSCFLPIMPVGIALVVCYKIVESYFIPDWSMAGPGRVFFVKPKSLIGSFLWDCYLKQSMYVGQFYLVGTNKDAIDHTWKDTILTKDFWRASLTSVDGRLPRELGRWDEGKLTMNYPLDTCDVVVKLPDSYLGIGDAFWTYGKEYKNVEELTKQLEEHYVGKEAMVLEMVRPKKELGVHSLDIVTVRTPDDDVKVLSCLLWTDCTTDSSHSCRAGYCVEVESEEIIAPAAWYSPFFATMDAPLVGTKMAGVREACATAVAAHKGIEHKWLTAVGWDAMVMKEEVVFFEGNFAGARTPRRMFLSLSCLLEFIKSFAWPFGQGGSMRPGVQV